LPALSADTTSRAAKLRTLLTGDSAHQYNVEGSTEHQPAEEEPADASNETVSEVQRLRYMIDSINASAAVLPKVSASGCSRLLWPGPSAGMWQRHATASVQLH